MKGKHYGNSVARSPKTSRRQMEASSKRGSTGLSKHDKSKPAPKGLAMKHKGGN